MSVSSFFTASDSMQSILEKDPEAVTPTKTKIACTLGPQSREVSVLEKLLENGMEIARIDLSWGTKNYHQVTINNLRRAMRHTKFLCAVMLDVRGQEIQIVNGPDGSPPPIHLKENVKVTLTCDTTKPVSDTCLPITGADLKGYALKPGGKVFLGRYLFTGHEESSVYLTIDKVSEDSVECTCNADATLIGHRLLVNFLDCEWEGPALSEDDVELIKSFGVQNKIDFIALSYCSSPANITECREILDNAGLTSTKIIAKIETNEGLANLSEIVPVADGIIFSRGHLGVAINAEKMFLVQKTVIKHCNEEGKPVVVTRVVDSMTENPRPTRAEATDIANLTLDGADCILLGAETFRGNYPVETVSTISKICRRAEMSFDSELYYQSLVEDKGGTGEVAWKGTKSEALASSAVRAAAKLDAALIIVFTITGNTARMVAKYRPPMPILSVVFPRLHSNALKWSVTGQAEARQVLLNRGVTALLADPNLGGTDEKLSMEGSMLSRAIAYAYKKKWVKVGDRVVVSQCPKTGDDDFLFKETGVVKIILLTRDILEASINTYNSHSISISSGRVKDMFKFMPKAMTFKGRPINELPSLISFHRRSVELELEGIDSPPEEDVSDSQDSS
ncbi:hypothetical protein BSKO_10458 [Bryopsis sp. KO-2023]|nr:hypothetical protein BSKO_10458 [Bryopsis sp. KO-2023]